MKHRNWQEPRSPDPPWAVGQGEDRGLWEHHGKRLCKGVLGGGVLTELHSRYQRWWFGFLGTEPGRANQGEGPWAAANGA